MLPAFVITGFLGSGKTTLLVNSAREHFQGKRVAVIVNELGEVGVDGKVLKNAYSEVLELPEGCICCSLHSEFEKAIKEIREKYDPQLLLVETSGGAVPFPIILSLQALGCSVDGVICLVDCWSFEKYREDSTARYQIGGSNVIVLNKTDLVEEKRVLEIEREVLDIWRLYRPVNSFTGEPFYTRVRLYRAVYGRLPEEVFSGAYTIPELKNIATEHGHSHHHRVINLIEPVDYEELEKRLKSLPENIIRAKGIVRLKHYPFPVAVNYSFGYIDNPIEVKGYDGPSFLVLIEN
ncbi:MAG: CobW family GTP-binding protein [Aquificaceae bacterium]|jgi:G3E family GTPase|uniref:CobW family GTP-binding protein n=1 Tax=Hydrogenobacter sp. Uz 6-8 TaxID=3384828 RepID=UPI000F268D04|nr:MAG: GTP-binding protein [Aquificota bacterium]